MSELGHPVCSYCGRQTGERGKVPVACGWAAYFVCPRYECQAKLDANEPLRFEGYAKLVEIIR